MIEIYEAKRSNSLKRVPASGAQCRSESDVSPAAHKETSQREGRICGLGYPTPGCFGERVWMLQKLKDLTFCDAQKRSQECENRGVNTIGCCTSRDSDRKGESFGDEMDSAVGEVFAKRGDPETQKCGAEEDGGDWRVKITTQITRWVR